MYKLLFIIPFVVFMTCDGGGKPVTHRDGDAEITFENSNFTYDVPVATKPFAQKIGDTLIVADYWAVAQGSGYRVDVRIDGNIITLEYLRGYGVEVDWMATVETVLKFTGTFPDSLTFKFKCCAPNARSPWESEEAVGFRNARDSLVKVVYRDSL